MQQINVLECIRQGQIGGGESHLLSVVENLNRSVFHPVILSFTDGPMIERLRQLKIDSRVIFTEKPFDFTKWKKVRHFLKEKRIDIVHAHGTRANSNVLWAARSLNIPVVYTVHGWSFHQDQHPAIRYIRVLSEQYLTSRSAVNICVSASSQQSGKAQIKDFRSIVINNGIDQKKFFPSATVKDIRHEQGISKDAVLVLFIARFTHQKQPLLLIRAFLQAAKEMPSLHLLMVGDGEQKKEAEALISDADAGSSITLLPFRQDVPDVLAAADIFVLPSLWEGLPIGLLEAMAMGKAIIASEVDGTKEVIKNRENGLLVAPGNIPALTEAILALAKNETARKAYQHQAQLTVKKEFNASVMTRQIEDVYKDIVNGKATPNSQPNVRTA